MISSAGRGGKRDEEERGTSNEDERAMRSEKKGRVVKKMKKWLEDASLTPAVSFTYGDSHLYW